MYIVTTNEEKEDESSENSVQLGSVTLSTGKVNKQNLNSWKKNLMVRGEKI